MKKAFTLLELIIVITIISLLLPAFKNVFQMENKKSIQGKTCVNSSYGKMRNFFDNAITGRGYYTGNDWKYPAKYVMDVKSGEEKIELKSGKGTNFDTLVFTGEGRDREGCFGVGYYINLTGDIKNVGIKRGLGGDINNPPFVITGINGNSITTGEIIFEFKKNKANIVDKKTLAKIFIDKRTSQFNLNRCLLWEDGGESCKKWSNSNKN